MNRSGSPPPNIGDPIESICDCLGPEHFIRKNNRILPNILVNEHQYLNIHIIATDSNESWVIFVDNSEAAENLRQKAQIMNEKELDVQKAVVREKGIGLKVATLVNLVIFKWVRPGVFELVNSPPDWVVDLLTGTECQKSAIDLAEHFAYLEAFLLEAQVFWDSNENGKIDSCIWTEIDDLGKEYHLQAYALTVDDDRLIVIIPINSYMNEKRTSFKKPEKKA